MSTSEADPFWCRQDEIPYHEMWEDDVLWLPLVLAGVCVLGDFIFENDRLRSHEIERVDQTEIRKRVESGSIKAKGDI